MEGLGETKGTSKSSPINSCYSTPKHSVINEQHKRSPFYRLIKYLKILSDQTLVYTYYSLRDIFTVGDVSRAVLLISLTYNTARVNAFHFNAGLFCKNLYSGVTVLKSSRSCSVGNSDSATSWTVRILVKARDFFVLQNLQTGSAAYPTSY